MRGILCRGLRLELVAGLGLALAMPALTVAAHAQALDTQTTLTAEARGQAGQTQITVAVTSEDGLPASGPVSIFDHGKQLAGVALDAQGQAKVVLDLAGGEHLLRAVFAGDATHKSSVSLSANVQAAVTATPDFQISAAPTTLSLVPGNAGTVVVTVTPVNNAALTGPMFVTLSCSGLPDQASCTFTPENLQILSTTPTSCAAGAAASACPPTSAMVLLTSAASTTATHPAKNSSPIAWAFLLPGALGLGGLAWGLRRREWLSRLSLVALVGLVTLMGTTACNPRYDYQHHGPVPNPATPAGTYTVTVTGQTSNGVTATTHNTSVVLTVK